MRANLKAMDLFETAYINLSEQLRGELELKIDKLYAKNYFAKYTGARNLSYQNASKADFLCTYLISRPPRDYVLSGKLLQGIKTWFNMYYDDRLSVIDKFRSYYQLALQYNETEEKSVLSVQFSKFLINELLSILADHRWQMLISDATRRSAVKRSSLN